MNRSFFLIFFLAISSVLYAEPLNENKILDAFEALYQSLPNPNFYGVKHMPNPKEPGVESFHLELKNIPIGTKFDFYSGSLSCILKPKFLFSGFIDRNGNAVVYENNMPHNLSDFEFFGK